MRSILLFSVLCCAVTANAAAPRCPTGDAPTGESDSFAVERSAVDVNVVGSVAAARYTLTLKGNGVAMSKGSYSLSLNAADDAPALVVHSATIREGRGARRPARLAKHDKAREKFDSFEEALSFGVEKSVARGGVERAAVLISDVSGKEVSIEVVAACSVTQVTIELDAAVLSVPHSGGARFVVPRVTPHDHVKVRSDDHELWVEGLRPGRGGKVSLPVEYDENAEVAYLTVDARPHEQRVRAAAAVHNVVVDQQQHAIVQLAVDLPSPLVTPSSEPHFVFILDASVSIGEAGIQQGLRVVRGVLDAAPPGARWAMVTSTRTPRLVVQPWRARDDRFVPRIDVENGSDVAAAMALAQKMASDAVDGRVIVVSDFLLSNHLDTDDRLIASTKGAVTHMIELPGSADEDGAPFSFSRTREDATAQAAERTGGMGLVVSKSGSVDSERTLMRSLVAPTSLDEPRIFINGEAMEDAEAEFIIEGDGLRRSFALPQRVTNVEVRGLLWGEEVRLDMQRLPKRAAIGSAINGSLRNTLDDDVVFAAASTLQFVSRMTSLVEVPTFRPAQPEGFGFGRSGCGCGGCGCGLGRRFRTGCRMGVGHNLPDERPTLEAIGNRIADICRVSFAGQVEIGALEILAVDVKAEQPSAQMCVTELLWRERIDQLGVPEHTFRAQRMREIRGEYSADESAASDGGDESDLAADDDGVVADEDVIDSDAAADEHDSE